MQSSLVAILGESDSASLPSEAKSTGASVPLLSNDRRNSSLPIDVPAPAEILTSLSAFFMAHPVITNMGRG